jgi:hypothetical protein
MASGSFSPGQPFTLAINISGLNSDNADGLELYDYSFDTQFDPTSLQVVSIGDGTIFNYNNMTGDYDEGTTYSNANGVISQQNGLDTYGGFAGTGGLLGEVTFESIGTAPNTTITVNDVELANYNEAQNGTSESNPGASITLNNSVTSSVPEPATSLLFSVAVSFAFFRIVRERLGRGAR